MYALPIAVVMIKTQKSVSNWLSTVCCLDSYRASLATVLFSLPDESFEQILKHPLACAYRSPPLLGVWNGLLVARSRLVSHTSNSGLFHLTSTAIRSRSRAHSLRTILLLEPETGNESRLLDTSTVRQTMTALILGKHLALEFDSNHTHSCSILCTVVAQRQTRSM